MKPMIRVLAALSLLIAPGFYLGYWSQGRGVAPAPWRDPWLIWIVPYLVSLVLVFWTSRTSKFVAGVVLLIFGLWALAMLFTGA